MEFVARAGDSSEPHPLEAVVSFQVREAHLDALSFVARSGERLCLHLPPRDIAGVLVEIARDLARVGRGAPSPSVSPMLIPRTPSGSLRTAAAAVLYLTDHPDYRPYVSPL